MSDQLDIRPFRVEGISIRTREKPVDEKVPQSRKTVLDQHIAPEIFLHADGQLYFRDQQTVEPIPLQKIENFYKRIRTVDGELRFYDRDLITYVTLFQVINAQQDVEKANSLIFSNTKVVDPPIGFSGIDLIKNNINEFTGSQTLDISAAVPIESLLEAREKFKTSFQEDTLRYYNSTPFDTMMDFYLQGLKIRHKTDAEIGVDAYYPVWKIRSEFDCFGNRWVGSELVEELGCVKNATSLYTGWSIPVPVAGMDGCLWESEQYIVGDRPCVLKYTKMYMDSATTLEDIIIPIEFIGGCVTECPSISATHPPIN